MDTMPRASAGPSEKEVSEFSSRMNKAVSDNADPNKRSALFAAIKTIVDEMRSAGCQEFQIYLITARAISSLNPNNLAATNILMLGVRTHSGVKSMETDPAHSNPITGLRLETGRAVSSYILPADLRDGPDSEL